MLIKIQDITKIYRMGENELRALNKVSCEIAEGEFIAVMGHSGSGKSTFMNILGLLDTPESGRYEFNALNTAQMNEDAKADFRLRTMGFIFQNFNLLPRLSALKNVELPMIYLGKKLVEREKKARQVLESVGMAGRLQHRPSELSGGQQQRVAMARALVNNPRIIFADEPTGNLDSVSSQEIMEILTEFNRQGKTIVMVTHEQDIAKYAKRVIHFKDGRIE